MKKIYYPDIFERGKFTTLENQILSKPGTFVDTTNTDLLYSIKTCYCCAKIVELSFCYDLIYLDSIDYCFMIKEIINRYKDNAIGLIKKISFIDSNNYNLTYRKKDNKWSIIVTVKKDYDFDKIINEIYTVNNDLTIIGAVEYSMNNYIKLEMMNVKEMADKCYNEIIYGFYQFLAITDTDCININDTNKAIFDLILLNYRNDYICDKANIECIYKTSFEQKIEEIRLKFSNSISLSNATISKEKKYNFLPYIINNENILDFIANKMDFNKYNLIEIDTIEYNGMYEHLKKSISYLEKLELGSSIKFELKQNYVINVPIISFDDYFGNLNEVGECIRSSKLFIKLITRKFAIRFIEDGEIKFSIVKDWVDEFDKTKKTGRADGFEGVLNIKSYGHTIKRFYRDSNRNVLNNYCWCCLSLDNLHFVHKEKINGVNYPKAIIKKEYFEDFAENIDNNEIEYGDEYVALLIDPSKFVERLFEYLKNNGFVDFDFGPVVYVNKLDQKVKIRCNYPYELFYKDFRFINQKEVRCILKRNNSKFYSFLDEHNGIIKIGSLKDVAQIVEIKNDDLSFVLQNDNKTLFKMAKPNDIDLDKLNFNDLLDVFIDYFIGCNFKINLKDIENFNEIFKKYSLIIIYENNTLKFKSLGMNENDYKLLLNMIKKIDVAIVHLSIPSLIKNNDINKLRSYYSKYENDSDYSTDILLIKAILNYIDGSYDIALKNIMNYQMLAPYNLFARYYNIKILMATGDYFKAKTLCLNSIEMFDLNHQFKELLDEIDRNI